MQVNMFMIYMLYLCDVLCALFTINGTADYCLSDDTDMFLYNSPKVLRNISLIR